MSKLPSSSTSGCVSIFVVAHRRGRFVIVLLRPTASTAAQPSLASHEWRRGLPGLVRAAARDEAVGTREKSDGEIRATGGLN